MRIKSVAGFSLLAVLPYLNGTMATGQVQDTVWEARPKVVSAIDLLPRTRLETWVEFQEGLDFSFERWRTGSLLSRRMKPILNMPLRDIDEENDHYLVLGGGYEYLHTNDRGSLSIENTIIAYATPHILFAGLLLGDRNRTEFRWINGVYSFRYRNRLTVMRESQVRTFRFTPYVYGELFYNSTNHSWNQREYATGVQFPYKSRLMLDTYLLRESCTSCSLGSVNMIGVTLNLYLRQIQ
jgi:Protein of unknown function (DUF2490)